MLRTGARWQDIPPEYGNTTNILRRFYRWRDNGVWVAILEVLLEHPEYDWLTNSESPRYSGSLAGQLWPWMRLFKENDLLKQAHLPPKLAQQLTAR
jgi:transposase